MQYGIDGSDQWAPSTSVGIGSGVICSSGWTTTQALARSRSKLDAPSNHRTRQA
jgi:hypothetical protein